jgi:Mg/Co/Ni transporter MgtE
LTQLQKDIETSLIKIKSTEEPKLQEMADLYASMKPEDAVSLLKQLSTTDAIKIFTHLQPKIKSKFISYWLNTAASDDEKKALMSVLDGMKRVVPDDGSGDAPADGTEATPPPPGQ